MATILGRGAWGAAPRRDSPQRTQPAAALVVHHTAGTRPASRSAAYATILAVQQHHQNANGWTDIAYNFLVTPDGAIIEGRGTQYQNGANTPRNTDTLSVCLLGNFNHDTFTDAEQQAITGLADLLGLRGFVIPHSQVSATECPGDQVEAWLAAGMPTQTQTSDVRAEVAAALEAVSDAKARLAAILTKL